MNDLAKTSPGSEVAVRTSSDLAGLDELEEILTGDREPPEIADDPTEISREIMAQILASPDEESIWQVGQATGWRELEGLPVQLLGFRWRRSSFEEGAPVFFVVQARRMDDGERIVLTTGSGNVLAQLVALARHHRLVGTTVKLQKAAKPSASGYYPYWLVKVADTPDPGTDDGGAGEG